MALDGGGWNETAADDDSEWRVMAVGGDAGACVASAAGVAGFQRIVENAVSAGDYVKRTTYCPTNVQILWAIQSKRTPPTLIPWKV